MSDDMTMRQDDRVTSVTFTLPAGHKWTSAEAAMKEAHDREYELRMAFFWECQRLKAEVERLESMADENAHLHKGIYSLSLNVGQLKDEVERLTALVESNLNSSKVAMGKADAMLHERDSLKAEVERLRKDSEYERMYREVIEVLKEGKQP